MIDIAHYIIIFYTLYIYITLVMGIIKTKNTGLDLITIPTVLVLILRILG